MKIHPAFPPNLPLTSKLGKRLANHGLDVVVMEKRPQEGVDEILVDKVWNDDTSLVAKRRFKRATAYIKPGTTAEEAMQMEQEILEYFKL